MPIGVPNSNQDFRAAEKAFQQYQMGQTSFYNYEDAVNGGGSSTYEGIAALNKQRMIQANKMVSSERNLTSMYKAQERSARNIVNLQKESIRINKQAMIQFASAALPFALMAIPGAGWAGAAARGAMVGGRALQAARGVGFAGNMVQRASGLWVPAQYAARAGTQAAGGGLVGAGTQVATKLPWWRVLGNSLFGGAAWMGGGTIAQGLVGAALSGGGALAGAAINTAGRVFSYLYGQGNQAIDEAYQFELSKRQNLQRAHAAGFNIRSMGSTIYRRQLMDSGDWTATPVRRYVRGEQVKDYNFAVGNATRADVAGRTNAQRIIDEYNEHFRGYTSPDDYHTRGGTRLRKDTDITKKHKLSDADLEELGIAISSFKEDAPFEKAFGGRGIFGDMTTGGSTSANQLRSLLRNKAPKNRYRALDESLYNAARVLEFNLEKYPVAIDPNRWPRSGSIKPERYLFDMNTVGIAKFEDTDFAKVTGTQVKDALSRTFYNINAGLSPYYGDDFNVAAAARKIGLSRNELHKLYGSATTIYGYWDRGKKNSWEVEKEMYRQAVYGELGVDTGLMNRNNKYIGIYDNTTAVKMQHGAYWVEMAMRQHGKGKSPEMMKPWLESMAGHESWLNGSGLMHGDAQKRSMDALESMRTLFKDYAHSALSHFGSLEILQRQTNALLTPQPDYNEALRYRAAAAVYATDEFQNSPVALAAKKSGHWGKTFGLDWYKLILDQGGRGHLSESLLELFGSTYMNQHLSYIPKGTPQALIPMAYHFGHQNNMSDLAYMLAELSDNPGLLGNSKYIQGMFGGESLNQTAAGMGERGALNDYGARHASLTEADIRNIVLAVGETLGFGKANIVDFKTQLQAGVLKDLVLPLGEWFKEQLGEVFGEGSRFLAGEISLTEAINNLSDKLDLSAQSIYDRIAGGTHRY